MNNEMQIFNFNGNAVRTTKDEKGEPWFVAKDVADILGYGKTEAMTRRMDDDEKDATICSTLGGEQKMTVINESGLYNAILGSSKPEAKAFRKWVTSEVLPAIRKDGGYIASRADETPEMIMARALQVAQATIEKHQRQLAEAEKQIEEAKPKVAFVELFCTAKNSNVLIREFANTVNQALGLKGFGQTAMFDYLKSCEYLTCNGYPTKKATDLRVLEVREYLVGKGNGESFVSHTTKITPKGQTYFLDKIKEKINAIGKWWGK